MFIKGIWKEEQLHRLACTYPSSAIEREFDKKNLKIPMG